MDIIRLLYTVLLIASLVCAVFLISYAYKRRTMPGAKYFILLLLAALVYNGGYIGEINAATKEGALFWFHFEHIGIPVQHYLWAVMSLEFVRINRKYLRTAKLALLYHPVLYYALYFTNDIHHLYISQFDFVSNGFFHVLYTVKGPAYMFAVASGTILAVICFGAYIRAYARSSRLHRYGYLIMIAASLLPWIAVYLTVSPTNSLSIDYFPIFSSVSGIFYLIGIFQYKLFQIVPIATDMVYRQAREGIMLIDQADRIIEANVFMTEIYPDLRDLKKRLTFALFVKSHNELGALTAGEQKIQYQLLRVGEERYYFAQMISIKADEEHAIGKMLAVSDITHYVMHQKQLESIADRAINQAETNEISFLQAQIKPHFLNNTLSVISAMITSDPGKAKALIADLGEYLVRSCYFDSSTDMAPLAEELETVNIYVAIQRARFGERISYKLDCADIPAMFIPRLVLQPLVENAIRHGILKKAEGGQVTLQIEVDHMGVCFKVIDNGVGMAADILASLMKQQNLKDGVGMLNIHKRLIKYYGEGLKVQSMPGSGTEVSFRISYEQGIQEVVG
jgi:two-component system LytT family sensor kinase